VDHVVLPPPADRGNGRGQTFASIAELLRQQRREPDQLRFTLRSPQPTFDQAAEALQRETRALCERYPLMSLDRAALIARRKLRMPPPSELTVTLRLTR
jgi:hypothetical protein